MSASLNEALGAIPIGLQSPLVMEFTTLLAEYRAGRWEAVGLKAGKLCEIVHSILAGHIAGSFASAPSKPRNMLEACTALERAPSTFSRSVRIQIPRILIAVYELRNNRAIGHVGGDVDPNHMDAEFFLRSAKWIIAELVRVFGNISIQEAGALVEGLTERILPIVWEDGNVKRILNPRLSSSEKALVLLYSSAGSVTAKQLAGWMDYSNLSRFRKSVLAELHSKALVHFESSSDQVQILPPGAQVVEGSGLLVT